MNKKLFEVLERIYNQGKYVGWKQSFEEWICEEGCEDRGEFITNLIKEALEMI